MDIPLHSTGFLRRFCGSIREKWGLCPTVGRFCRIRARPAAQVPGDAVHHPPASYRKSWSGLRRRIMPVQKPHLPPDTTEELSRRQGQPRIAPKELLFQCV